MGVVATASTSSERGGQRMRPCLRGVAVTERATATVVSVLSCQDVVSIARVTGHHPQS